MTDRFWGVPLWLWIAGTLLVAAVYAVVWPRAEARGASGPRFWLLRWGHAAVWAVLAASFALRAGGLERAAGAVSAAALALYVVFLLSLRAR